MSGIYIPGMEMPKDCGHCPLNKLNTEYGGLVYECIITGHYLDDGYEGTIMSNCPLIPVPDHGRLIDADKLIEVIIEQESNEYNITHFPKSWARAMCAFEEMVLCEPTIIPRGEAKNENQTRNFNH